MKNRSPLPVLLSCAVGLMLALGVLLALPAQEVQAAYPAQDATDTCKNCHSDAYTLWEGSHHNTGNVNCLVCHKLAQGEGAHPDVKYTVESEDVTCLVCHTSLAGENIAGQLELSQHGQVGLKCTSCHEQHSQELKLAQGSTNVCENCHKTQMDNMEGSTHEAAGLACANCHMGPEHSHTLKVAAETCEDCHVDLHSADRIVSAGLDVAIMATPEAVPAHAEVEEEPAAAAQPGGINLPSWVFALGGFIVGGIGTWALIGKDPIAPKQ